MSLNCIETLFQSRAQFWLRFMDFAQGDFPFTHGEISRLLSEHRRRVSLRVNQFGRVFVRCQVILSTEVRGIVVGISRHRLITLRCLCTASV